VASTETTPEYLVEVLAETIGQLARLRTAGDAMASAMLVGDNDEKATALRDWREATERRRP